MRFFFLENSPLFVDNIIIVCYNVVTETEEVQQVMRMGC